MKYIWDKTLLEGRGRSHWAMKNRRRLIVHAGNLASIRRAMDDMRSGRVVKFSDVFEGDDAADGGKYKVMMTESVLVDLKEALKPSRDPPNWAKDPRKYRLWR